MIRERILLSCAVACLTVTPTASIAAQAYPARLTDAEPQTIRSAIAEMKRNPRGPYLHLRWFCADGTVHPPQGTPCRELGGGVQHAVWSDVAKQLAAMGVHVGTILQATPQDSLVDSAHAYYRIRELPIAQYLYDIDDGWALRRARFYRGARQIGNEEARGRELLQRLASDSPWMTRHYLLAMRLAATVPHARAGDAQSAERVRNLATEAAALDSGFLDVRIKIHSFPSSDDLAAVERYAARTPNGPARVKLIELRDELQRFYDAERRLQTIAAYERIAPEPLRATFGRLRGALHAGNPDTILATAAAASEQIRRVTSTSGNGRTGVDLLDANHIVLEQAFIAGRLVDESGRLVSRQDRLHRVAWYVRLAYGAGFLSGRERDALLNEIATIRAASPLRAVAYKNSLGYLTRAFDWGSSTVRGTFGAVLQRYAQFEPLAAGYVDAILRSSVLLPLSSELGRLTADADRVLGTSHRILGADLSQGVRGVNPGVVRAPIEILDRAHVDSVNPSTIYVLPETPAELKPVGGVLTMDEGNLLSHIQLLARNLGIPNAAVRPDLLERLERASGDEVLFAVSPLGRVVLERTSMLPPEMANLAPPRNTAPPTRVTLDVSRLRLDHTAPIPLSELRARLSGVTVGPKAANLGELAALFPDQVSRGVALPFGMFYQHANRPFESNRTVLENLTAAYQEAARLRRAGSPERDVNAFMFARLAEVRRAIQELPWIPEHRSAVVEAITTTFGVDIPTGVFIRSDTNVEDLPQFSGAGLNLTVAHQRTIEDVLQSIKRVWTSPFTERAYLWRKQILDEQGQVYPSVLLLESVPSEKSGVMITTGLQGGRARDLTIVTAEGVGGGVEGEDAETILVGPQGQVRLLSQAKAVERRTLRQAGGVTWMASRQPDSLLTTRELSQLRDIARRWEAQLTGDDVNRAWDVEFGFTNGKLWLFQIRPFVGFRNAAALERLAELDRDVTANADRPVSLESSS